MNIPKKTELLQHRPMRFWRIQYLFFPWYNALITILLVFGIGACLWKAIAWGIYYAVWTGPPTACSRGACWAALTEKGRLILFGHFPWEEQWRPFLAISLIIVIALMTVLKRSFSRILLYGWLIAFTCFYLLMHGGVFGLRFIPSSNWGGLPLTIMMASFAMAGGFPLGILLALGRRSQLLVIRLISISYIEIIRGVPIITILFMATLMLPIFLPEWSRIDKLLSAEIGILLFTAAYIAEIIRGGLQAIPRNQHEAADSLGFSFSGKMRLVILPQALRIVIPPLVNTCTSVVKNTSLVVIVGLYDLLGTAKAAITDPVWRAYALEIYIFVATIYFIICFTISFYSRKIERNMSSHGK